MIINLSYRYADSPYIKHFISRSINLATRRFPLKRRSILALVTVMAASAAFAHQANMTSGQQYGIRVLPAAGQKDTWIYNVPQESILWSTERPWLDPRSAGCPSAGAARW